jgi:regulator of protease activity HflC (stomatin/prohibitin superfamily)
MEKQMRAERKNVKPSSTPKARSSRILTAQGEKEAAVLRAEAVKIKKITEAEGEAEALIAFMKPKPGVRLINNRNLMRLLDPQGFEALHTSPTERPPN